MSLFIELYLDEDVDVLIADLLKAYGFSARNRGDDIRLISARPATPREMIFREQQ